MDRNAKADEELLEAIKRWMEDGWSVADVGTFLFYHAYRLTEFAAPGGGRMICEFSLRRPPAIDDIPAIRAKAAYGQARNELDAIVRKFAADRKNTP